YWKEIKDSTDAADFETFLQAFPESRFAPLARRRLTRLKAEAKANAGDASRQQAAGQASIEAEQAPAGPAAEDAVRAEAQGEQRYDATLKLEAPIAGDLNEAVPMLDFSSSPGMEPVSAALALRPFKGVSGRPVHARRRGTSDAHEQAEPARASPAPARSFGSSLTRKPLRMSIVAALAAVLVGGGVWYAAAPHSAPFVAALRTQTQSTFADLQEQWPAQAEAQRTDPDAARLAEARRESAEALAAERERERQLELARQKAEAAKAAANRDYQRAIALLTYGRTSEAVRALRELAYNGHGPAAKKLGDLYASGEKVLLDLQEAARFYALAEDRKSVVQGK